MNATVYSGTQLIGYADLEVGDSAMGGVYGPFVPHDFYYRQIQKTVWKFNSTFERDHVEWASLNLSVQLENGYFLFPIGGVEIDDIEKSPSEPKRIDIAGLASEVIEDYFKSSPSKAFVFEPWAILNIESKIAFEQELRKEIGANPGLHARNSNNHVLANCSFSALCISLQFDDVLFSVHTPDISLGNYALVHLTWNGLKDVNSLFPSTTFFESFAKFVEKRMIPDKIDFES